MVAGQHGSHGKHAVEPVEEEFRNVTVAVLILNLNLVDETVLGLVVKQDGVTMVLVIPVRYESITLP